MAEGSQDIILNVAGNTRQLERDIQRVASSNLILNTKGFSQPLGKITGQLGEFEKSLAASNARVIAFGVSAGAIYAVEKAFTSMVKSTISVEKSLAEINTILNTSQANLSKFGNQLFDLAKNTGQSFDTVAKSALEFSRQGLGVAETLKRTSDALILTRLSGLDVVSSTESITAALNSFNQTAISSNELVNKLIAVDTGFAVSSADLAEAIKRVGSSAQDAGVGLDELVALVTSAQQITARGGSVIGNSFKTIFTRLQRPEVLTALDELGVKTRDAQGNIAPLMQILGELSTRFETLSGTQKSQIAELVGGVFQINILKAALGDLSKEYSIFNQALNTSKSATDEANKRNEALNDTLSSSLNKTFANLTKAASDIGGMSLAPAIKKSLSGLNGILETFSTSGNEGDGVGAKIGEGIAKGIGNFLGGPGIVLATLGLYKIFERLTKFSADAFKTLSGMNTASSEQAQIQSQVLNIMSKNPALVQQIAKGNISVATAHKEILALIEQETMAMQQQIALASSLAKSLSMSGVSIGKSGPMQGMVISNKAIGKSKSFGYIPNFDNGYATEVIGAALGGYKAGNIKRRNIKNQGEVIYNDAESIVKYPGFEEEAVLPPENSQAGKLYKNNFMKEHGFNPYKAFGYIPNFANPSVPKDYIKIQGDFADSLTNSFGILRPEYKGFAYTQGRNVYVDRSKQDSLLKEFKAKQEKSLQERDQSKSLSAEEYVLVYPSFGKSGIGSASAIANKYAGKPNFKFSTFGFPGGEVSLGEELFKNVSDGLVNASAKFVSSIATNPEIVNDKKFINSVKSNLNRSVIESAIGGVFEAGIKSSIGSIVDDPNAPLDLDSGELKRISQKFKNANSLGKFAAGDLKNALNSSNAISMANKIASQKGLKKDYASQKKSKSFGYIPNFSSIQQAIEREQKASGKKAEVLWSDTLGMPVVVNNSQTAKYGANADKIIKNDHINQGQLASKSNLMKTGSGKEVYNNEFTPNFAAPKNWSDPSWEQYDSNIRAGIGKSNFDLAKPFDDIKKQLEVFLKMINSWTSTGTEADKTLKGVAENLKKTKSKSDQLLVDGVPLTPEAILGKTNKAQQTGFVDKAKGGIQKAFDDNTLSEGMQNFKNKLVFASFGLSMIGGFASSMAGADKKMSSAIDGATQSIGAATTAMGIIPGPVGLAVGGVIGLAGSINSLAHYLNDKSPDFAAALDKAKEQTSAFSDGAQKYSSVFQKAQDMFNNPKTSASELVKINKELNAAAREIPSAYRLQLLAIQDNTKLQEEITKIQKDLVQKQSGLEFATDFQSQLDSKGAVPQFFQDYIKGLAGGGEGWASYLGQASVQSLMVGKADDLAGALGLTRLQGGIIKIQDSFYDMIDRVAEKAKGTIVKTDTDAERKATGIIKGFSEEGKSKFEKDFSNPAKAEELRNLNKNEFINKLQTDYGLNKDIGSSLKNSTKEDIDRLREKIISLGRDASETSQAIEKTEGIRQEARKRIDAEKKSIEMAKASVEAFKLSLDGLAKTAISFNNFQQRYSQQNSSNERSLGIEKARSQTALMEPFLDPFGKAKLDFQLEKASRNEDFINQSQDIISSTNKNLMDQSTSYLDKLRDKGVSEDKLRQATLDLAKVNQNQSSGNLKDSISAIFEKNIGKDMSMGQREELNSQLTSEMTNQTQALLTLNQKTDQANKIAEAQLAAQKAMATRDVYRGSFGGQGALSNPNFESERENAFKNVDENFNKRGFNVSQFSNTYDLIGGFTPGEMESSYYRGKIGDFMSGMASNRAEDIRYQADTAIESIRRAASKRGGFTTAGEDAQIAFLEKRRSEAGKIAQIQVAEKLKTGEANKNMGLNIQGIGSDVKGIYQLLNEIANKQQDETISSGIQKALQEGMSQLINGFTNSLTDLESKLGQSKIIADETEKIGKANIERINEATANEINKAVLGSKQSQAPSLAARAETLNPEVFNFVNAAVKKAQQNNQSIPSLQEMQESYAKQGNSLATRGIKGLTEDTGSVGYQAFDAWLNTIRDIQNLQQKIKEDVNEIQQQESQIQPTLNATTPQGVIPSVLNGANQIPNQNNIQSPQNVQLNQGGSALDRFAQFMQRLQNVGPTSATGGDIKSAIKEGYNELKQSAQSQGAQSESEDKKDINGKVEVSPMSVDGQVKVSLEGDQLTVKIDSADLENTKAALEQAFDEKLNKVKQDIYAQIKDFINERINNETKSNPSPSKFRANNQYNFG